MDQATQRMMLARVYGNERVSRMWMVEANELQDRYFRREISADDFNKDYDAILGMYYRLSRGI